MTFDSFGYEAVEKYASLQDERNEQRYYFFQHFKMALINDKVGTYMLKYTLPCK